LFSLFVHVPASYQFGRGRRVFRSLFLAKVDFASRTKSFPFNNAAVCVKEGINRANLSNMMVSLTNPVVGLACSQFFLFQRSS
jgi:hypothetical protein